MVTILEFEQFLEFFMILPSRKSNKRTGKLKLNIEIHHSIKKL